MKKGAADGPRESKRARPRRCGGGVASSHLGDGKEHVAAVGAEAVKVGLRLPHALGIRVPRFVGRKGRLRPPAVGPAREAGRLGSVERRVPDLEGRGGGERERETERETVREWGTREQGESSGTSTAKRVARGPRRKGSALRGTFPAA